MQEAYIVAGYRTAVAKSKRGGFRFYRPDDLAIDVIKGLLASVPQLDKTLVDDVIVGNAVPEAEQGLQVGRIIAARAIGFDVPGELKDLKKNLLYKHKIFTGEAKPNVIRLLPSLGLTKNDADKFLNALKEEVAFLVSQKENISASENA